MMWTDTIIKQSESVSGNSLNLKPYNHPLSIAGVKTMLEIQTNHVLPLCTQCNKLGV